MHRTARTLRLAILCLGALTACADPKDSSRMDSETGAPPSGAGAGQSATWSQGEDQEPQDLGANARFPVIADGLYQLSAPAVRLRARLDADSVHLLTPTSAATLRFDSWGFDDDLTPLSPTEPAPGPCLDAPDPESKRPCARAIVYEHPGVRAWWLGLSQGIEQGWTVEDPGRPVSTLTLATTVEDALLEASPQGHEIIIRPRNGEKSISCDEARAHDAKGRPLPVALSVETGVILLQVLVEDASWPVEVDPLYSSTETISASTCTDETTDFGLSISGGGDLNADGLGDLVVGGTSDTYVLSCWYTSTTTPSFNFFQSLSASYEEATDAISVAMIGDLNNDGQTDDVVMGEEEAKRSYSDFGSSPTYHGIVIAARPFLTTILPVDAYPSDLNCDTARNYPHGCDETREGLGIGVAAAGDWNHDMYDDVVAGSTDEGILIFPGSAAGFGTPIRISSSTSSYGESVGGGGDINGDGYDDVLVGVPVSAGSVVIQYGTNTSTRTSNTVATPSTAYYFGYSMAVVGDVNGDGLDDFAVGDKKGQLFVYHGLSDTAATFTPSASVVLTEESGDQRVAVAAAGDVNGDGYADVIAGVADISDVFFFEGGPTGISTTAATTITKTSSYDFGISVTTLGDANGDGFDDVAIGAPEYGTDGRVYAYFGYIDADGDGYGLGYGVSADCDDTNAAIHAGAEETNIGDEIDTNCDGRVYCYADADLDGYRSATASVWSADADCADSGERLSGAEVDCNDALATTRPGAPEIPGDGIDQDCSGFDTCYYDSDDDDYGSSTTREGTTLTCTGTRESVNDDDCNDANSAIKPGATELTGDEIDQNCNGQEICYVDADHDGYRSSTATATIASTVDILCNTADGEAKATATANDCNDADGNIHPYATELPIDDVDQDCDGRELCYLDADADSYGSSATELADAMECVVTGLSDNRSDCDDGNAAIHPGAAEIVADGTDEDCNGQELCFEDSDGDGYGSEENTPSTDLDCDDSGESAEDSDCDDTATGAAIHPGAAEVVVDGIDQDCNGADLCYVDADGDGYGSSSTRSGVDMDCDTAGVSPNHSDCNDTATGAPIHPGATEGVADGVDQNCDGGEICSIDADHDGYGSMTSTVPSMDTDCADVGEAASTSDCDDANALVHPSASEIPVDGVDQNCDGKDSCYQDFDRDGYGSTTVVAGTSMTCTSTGGISTVSSDCNDANSLVHPGATEIVADGIDENCDGGEVCSIDLDRDGYGSATYTVTSSDTDCEDPGEALSTSDCDDENASVHPGATETPVDGVDQNCDGKDLCYQDRDADHYGSTVTVTGTSMSCTGSSFADNSSDCNDYAAAIYPGAPERIADGIDEDCDGGEICYLDNDRDGYGTSEATVASSDGDCVDPAESTTTSDCDDGSTSIHPGASEVPADGVDQDCDARDLCYADMDGDSYGATTTVTGAGLGCTGAGESRNNTDCNDGRASIYPSAAEVVADGLDQDCDGGDLCYLDTDHDAYGSSETVASTDLDCSDSDESRTRTDCDDTQGSIYPGAPEVAADGVDQNCDSKDLCYRDWDGDLYGSTDTVTGVDTTCTGPGESDNSSDCGDSSSDIYPGAPEIVGDEIDENCDGKEVCYQDLDGDDYRTSLTVASSDSDCTDASEASSLIPSDDCNDYSRNIYPGATEIAADGIDQDCSGGDTCLRDSDADGYGATTTVASADLDCLDAGESTNSSDCDDSRASIYPGAAESPADGIDQDCSGGDLCYIDMDGDHYGTASTTASADIDCLDAMESSVDTDCNDRDDAIHPYATEGVGDLVDQNCDGVETCYVDADDDRYRSTTTVTSSDLMCSGSGEALASEPATDCDDSNASIRPGAVEIVADGIDQDCSGGEICYGDMDGDRYGSIFITASVDADCLDSGEATNNSDCNDANASIRPDAAEIAGDLVDQNCDGRETCYVDADGDTYRVSSVVESVDTDCSDAGEAIASMPDSDCDDLDASIHPTATELPGDDVNQDCATGELCYVDADDDGYRTIAALIASSADDDCTDDGEAMASDPATDCDDSRATTNPGAPEIIGDGLDEDCDGGESCYVDQDHDGFRPDAHSTVRSVDMDCLDAGEALDSAAIGDCDDTNLRINPDALERCDLADNDCDGATDETDDLDPVSDIEYLWYRDVDGDGFGKAAPTVMACSCPFGYSATSDDCDDTKDYAYPGAKEIIGDNIDEDCDGEEICFTDSDEDGYTSGDILVSENDDCLNAGEADLETATGDCDDSRSDVNPGAPEACDGATDENCDGVVDDASAIDAAVWYLDADGDGYGDPSVYEAACHQVPGWVQDPTDCDDASAERHPGAVEACNGIDDNCDGTIDEDTAHEALIWYRDLDRDGYGNPFVTIRGCVQPEGYVSDSTDCDDFAIDVHPEATEVLGDGVDQDCDGEDLAAGDTGLEEPKQACGCASSRGEELGGMTLMMLLGVLWRRRRAARIGHDPGLGQQRSPRG